MLPLEFSQCLNQYVEGHYKTYHMHFSMIFKLHTYKLTPPPPNKGNSPPLTHTLFSPYQINYNFYREGFITSFLPNHNFSIPAKEVNSKRRHRKSVKLQSVMGAKLDQYSFRVSLFHVSHHLQIQW